jgi:voltage-gated potassium channel
MTTVGYGDVSPVTDTGRMIGVVVMVVGIGFLSMLIGTVAEQFVAKDLGVRETRPDEEVEGADADLRTELRAITARLQALERRLGQ